jgi:hypothetical protein
MDRSLLSIPVKLKQVDGINNVPLCCQDSWVSMISPYFSRIFSALKMKCFQPNFAIFFTLFFTNSENATKSKFRQETLNILSTFKFTGSHLAFYE